MRVIRYFLIGAFVLITGVANAQITYKIDDF